LAFAIFSEAVALDVLNAQAYVMQAASDSTLEAMSRPFKAVTVPLAFAIGCLTLLLTLVLFGLVFALRLSTLKRKQAQQHCIEVWAPIWKQCFEGEFPETIPQLTFNDSHTFLTQWIQYQETSDESLRELLSMIALKAGLEKHLQHILNSRNVPEKTLAITAMGFLKDKSYESTFRQCLQSTNVSLSLAAARAWLQLDPHGAMPVLARMLRDRHDWPQARMILFFTEAGIDVISEPLAKMVMEWPTPKLIQYLAITNSSVAVPALMALLQTTLDARIIHASLQTLSKFNVEADLPLIRRFLNHPQWECRAAAAKIIGKMGHPQDENSLLLLLADSQNIVQYEAALALFEMPHFNRQYAGEVCSRLTGQTGLPVLTRVMAEKRWHA
jgi:HEAT repeats